MTDNSKPYSLNLRDLGKGLLLAVVVAVLGGIEQGLTAHGFSFSQYDWASITNLAITSFVAYLMKNFVQDKQGVPFGSAK